VFSGHVPLAPRCAMTSGGTATALGPPHSWVKAS